MYHRRLTAHTMRRPTTVEAELAHLAVIVIPMPNYIVINY